MSAESRRCPDRSRADGLGWPPAGLGGRALTASLCLVSVCACSSATTSGVPADDNDRVAIQGGASPSVLAVDGQGRTKCLASELFEGTGIIDLNDRVGSAPGCSTEIVAFSSDRAVELKAAPGWTHDPSNPVTLPVKPPVDVELRFYVPQGVPGAATAAQDEMDVATALYAKNRAGIAFKSLSTLAYSPAQEAVIGDRCGGGNATSLAKAGATLYDPDVINVYYVSQIDGSNYLFGYNCYQQSIVVGGSNAIGENIIFLSLASRAPTTLAHELGHALGLRGNVGHTYGVPGFTKLNLMMSGISLNDQALQDDFSLGQGYRMSLDRLSWLNHTRPSGTPPIRAGDNRPCQLTVAAATGDLCPPLALDK
jgi:hypothetical protein